MKNLKQNRYLRGFILLTIALSLYALVTNDKVMSYVFPQMQIGLVGIVKASVGAITGYLVGLFMFPHKILWDEYDIWKAGAIARLSIILLFTYTAYSYA